MTTMATATALKPLPAKAMAIPMPTTKLGRHITAPPCLGGSPDDEPGRQQGPPVSIAAPTPVTGLKSHVSAPAHVLRLKTPNKQGLQRQATERTADMTDHGASSSSPFPNSDLSPSKGASTTSTLNASVSSLFCLEDNDSEADPSETTSREDEDNGRISPYFMKHRSASQDNLNASILDAERQTDDASLSSDVVREKIHASFKQASANSLRKEEEEDYNERPSNQQHRLASCNSIDMEQEEEDRLLAELPRFDMRELKLGKFLGRGGFSDVEEIRAITPNALFQSIRKKTTPAVQLSKDETAELTVSMRSFNSRLSSCGYDDDDDSNDENPTSRESRAFIAKHCIRQSGEARYALKHLKKSIQAGDRQRFRVGILDLAVETQFLSRLEHPNIIKLRAISTGDPYSSDYFLILDRLYDTLHARILKWKRQHAQNKKKLVKRREAHRQLRTDRLLAAYDLSAAIDYLHENHIIHRDLKPDNIGFDVRGDIKIFDFGLAFDLRKEQADQDGTYLLSNMTGSLRYMAPEVGLGRRYNEKCDVYSYTLVFWEILALERPYLKYRTEQAFLDEIFARGRRPRIKGKWPEACKDIMEGGWHADQHQRHCMVDIQNLLRREVVDLQDGESDVLNLTHHRRRSTFIFTGGSKPDSCQFSSGSMNTSGSGSGQFARLHHAFSSRKWGSSFAASMRGGTLASSLTSRASEH